MLLVLQLILFYKANEGILIMLNLNESVHSLSTDIKMGILKKNMLELNQERFHVPLSNDSGSAEWFRATPVNNQEKLVPLG